ncbi:MAG: protein-glutamate O-methyltransferase CheR [Deferrisomatales bacterium]
MESVFADEGLPALDPESFRRIARLVYRHTGIHLGAGKAYFVEGRLGELFRLLGCRHWGELPERFERRAAPALRDVLVQAVVTAETRFFRDESPFRALRQIVAPSLVARRTPPVRMAVWCAGCSTGQEPYSVVMALWDLVETATLDVDVWATDISEAALDRARQGIYEAEELERGLDGACRRRFFRELGSGRAQVRDEVRRRVRFERLNLVAAAPEAGRFDLALCRNVAIYFDREGKKRLYRTLGASLRPGGYLVLGAAETLLSGVPGFHTVYFERALLFQKAGGGLP